MTPRPSTVPGRRAVDASMSLLNQVLYRPTEPGYAEAARRGPVERTPGRRRAHHTVTAVLAVALGVLTIAAVATLRVPSPAVEDGTELLAEEIRRRAAEAEDHLTAVERLNSEVAALEEAALVEVDPGLAMRLADYEVEAGAVPVSGPGLVVTLDDPESDDGPVSATARVQDVDLQIVVNALWAAGADAVAINGERLTSVSAIRGAGQAILVDLAPLVAPYRVEAIGDTRTLQTGLARSSAGSHLTMLEGTYRVRTSIEGASSLTLPAASSTSLRYATPTDDVPADEATTGPVDEGEVP